jgi:hypothetical protein
MVGGTTESTAVVRPDEVNPSKAQDRRKKSPTLLSKSDRMAPRVYRTLAAEASAVRRSPTGTVGHLYTGEGIEVVWVSKQREAIDRRWFELPSVDLLLVIQGSLQVDFEDARFATRTLRRGDFLVLPPSTRCRAYRWPRSARGSTVFLAVYPAANRNPPGRSSAAVGIGARALARRRSKR